jgi:hypothetical protein
MPHRIRRVAHSWSPSMLQPGNPLSRHLLVSSVSALDTQVVSKLAALLERAIRVALKISQ